MNANKVRNVFEAHMRALEARLFGPEAVGLSPDDVQSLVDAGVMTQVEADEVLDLSGRAYTFGKMRAESEAAGEMFRPGDAMTFNRMVAQAPLTATETMAAARARAVAGQWAVGLGRKVADQAAGITSLEDPALRAAVMGDIQDIVSAGIESRTSWRKIASQLAEKTGDWTRDWMRLASTEVQRAQEFGAARWIADEFGENANVAKIPNPDACPTCRAVFLEDGRPKVFTMKQLVTNGSNVGRKAKDAVPTIEPTHPHCRCRIVNVPVGWSFGEDWSLLPPGGNMKLGKVTVTGGDADLGEASKGRTVIKVGARGGKIVKDEGGKKQYLGKDGGGSSPAKADKSGILAATNSIDGRPGKRVDLSGNERHTTEPHDDEDTFPPVIASWEVVDGWVKYKGRNGSEGVIVGSKAELEKWAKDVEMATSQDKVTTAREWTEADGGVENVRAAERLANEMFERLGVDGKIRLTTNDNKKLFGEASATGENAGIIGLQNVHMETPTNEYLGGAQLDPRLQIVVHEVAHLAYPNGGEAVMDALAEHSKAGGEYMSVYHALNNHFEGTMEAAGMYVLAPDILKKEAPGVYDAVAKWFSEAGGEASKALASTTDGCDCEGGGICDCSKDKKRRDSFVVGRFPEGDAEAEKALKPEDAVDLLEITVARAGKRAWAMLQDPDKARLVTQYGVCESSSTPMDVAGDIADSQVATLTYASDEDPHMIAMERLGGVRNFREWLFNTALSGIIDDQESYDEGELAMDRLRVILAGDE